MESFKALGFPAQVVISVLVAGVLFFVGYQYMPSIAEQKREIASKKARLADLEAEIHKGRNLEKRLPELEREIATLQAQLEELKAIIPPVRDDSKLLQQFESIAKRSRLEIKTIQPQRTRTKEFYLEYPIQMDVSGNYHDLAKFFDRMRNLPRIFNVQGVKLAHNRVRTSELSLSANFTAVTFIYREDVPPAGAANGKGGRS